MKRRAVLLGLTALVGTTAMAARRENLEDPTWTARSRAAEDLTPQFSFLLRESVYVGDPNSAEQFQSGRFDRPIQPPSFPMRTGLRPTAGEALGHEAELAAYYRRVMELRGSPPERRDSNYWMRLSFACEPPPLEVGFPWWDRVSEAAELMAWLHLDGDGEDAFDADQGWLFRGAKRGGRVHFFQGDLETEKEYANVSVALARFRERMTQAEDDVLAVITRLRETLGIDPWS